MKKEIKIKFSGMTGDFDEKNNFITNILNKFYDVHLSDDPEYLFYSLGSKDWYKYSCIRIFYTPENLVPDFNLADYAIGFSKIDFGDRYLRFPIFLVSSFSAYKNDDYGNSLQLALRKNLNIPNPKDKGFCSFVYSNPNGAFCREEVFDTLSLYKKVDSGGKFKNNINRFIDSKLEFQKHYKFSIAFENTSTPGYVTEKIVDSFAAGNIPIYWGDPDVCDIFNPDSFINCNSFGLTGYDSKVNSIALKRILEKIKEIDSDDNLYCHILSQPALIDCQYPHKMEMELADFLTHIIDQNLDDAYRRNRYYWGERYEKRQKFANKAFYLLDKFRIK